MNGPGSVRSAKAMQGSAATALLQVVCAVCGTYEAIQHVTNRLAGGDLSAEDARVRLTWACRRASDLGAPLTSTAYNIDEALTSVVEPRPLRRVDDLLLFIGRRLLALDATVGLSIKDWPVVLARSPGESNALLIALKQGGPAPIWWTG